MSKKSNGMSWWEEYEKGKTEKELRLEGYKKRGYSWVKYDDRLREWIKKEKVKNIELLGRNKSIEKRKKFVAKLCNRGAWDEYSYEADFDNNTETFSKRIAFENLTDAIIALLEQFRLNLEHKIFLMLEPTADIRVASFSYKDIKHVLEKMQESQFYIFDDSFTWTISSNDHAYLTLLNKKSLKLTLKELKNLLQNKTVRLFIQRQEGERVHKIDKEIRRTKIINNIEIEIFRKNKRLRNIGLKEVYATRIKKYDSGEPAEKRKYSLSATLEFTTIKELLDYLERNNFIKKRDLIKDES